MDTVATALTGANTATWSSLTALQPALAGCPMSAYRIRHSVMTWQRPASTCTNTGVFNVSSPILASSCNSIDRLSCDRIHLTRKMKSAKRAHRDTFIRRSYKGVATVHTSVPLLSEDVSETDSAVMSLQGCMRTVVQAWSLPLPYTDYKATVGLCWLGWIAYNFPLLIVNPSGEGRPSRQPFAHSTTPIVHSLWPL